MTHPSVNSIVERLEPCPFCGPGNSIVECYQDDYGYWKVGCGACGSHSGIRPKSDPDGRAKVVAHWNTRPAATEIERLAREVDLLGKLAAPPDTVRFFETTHNIQSAAEEFRKRALTAESSLSRIKEETIEECARIAEQTGNFGDYRRDELTADYGQPKFDMMNAIASAIRSLGSTGGAEKTAESGNPAPTREHD